jgi:hypothetical protein
MRTTIERMVIAFVLTLGVLMGMGYGQATIAHGLPSMTPDAAPVPRAAPTSDYAAARPTPSPKPGPP